MTENVLKKTVEDGENGAMAEEQQGAGKRIVNLRVAKVMLLGANLFVNEKKKTRAINVVFVDAVETDSKTGQPVMRGFNPIISCYVKEPERDVEALLNKPVFSPLFVRISGDENFTQFHGVLTDAEVKMYRQLMGVLAEGK